MKPLKEPDRPPSNFVIKKYRANRPKSPWALEDHHGNLVALFTYRKGARNVEELLNELVRMKRIVEGLRFIEDVTEPRRLDMVADRRR